MLLNSCMEHSLHLAASHFVANIAPVKAMNNLNLEGDDGDEYDVGNAIGKALALVQQVCHNHCWLEYILNAL